MFLSPSTNRAENKLENGVVALYQLKWQLLKMLCQDPLFLYLFAVLVNFAIALSLTSYPIVSDEVVYLIKSSPISIKTYPIPFIN